VRYVPPKRRLTLTGLHGVISQKMVLFTFEYPCDIKLKSFLRNSVMIM
jgi:hypothetical protein